MMNDHSAREQALNPQESFIIQAPAGSGKTELLIQRYLRLLSQCQTPNQVLAITFTKKAAGEMRHRIQKALQRAANPIPPQQAHTALTWSLARAVYERAATLLWSLDDIALDLSIMTIDACCQQLLRFCQPPYNLTAQLQLNLLPEPFYRRCIADFIRLYCQDPSSRYYQDFQTLLLYQFHDYPQVERLLVSALANREKWLSLAIQTKQQDFITVFADTIMHIQQAHINALLSRIPITVMRQLCACLNALSGYAHRLDLRAPLSTVVTIDHAKWDLSQWQRFSDFILSQSGTLRKRFASDQGFANQKTVKRLSAEDQEHYLALKTEFMECLAVFQDDQPLQTLLRDCNHLPHVEDPLSQEKILKPLFQLLPALAAFLQIQMESERCTDFSGINLQLYQALVDDTHHSHLTLRIYQNYRHVLIDEFQDTSVSQFRILELAFSTWQGEPDRSICLVGDPMQSIYRFRQAEVKLFNQVQKSGFAGISLIPLHLSANYRSCSTLVDQLNHCFSHFMTPDYNRFYPAQGIYHLEDGGLHQHTVATGVSQPEAIIALIQKLSHNHPQASQCLLVRSRNQLPAILTLLKHHDIAYTGIGLHPLHACQAVLDAYNLLCLPFDLQSRRHWIGFLNAPAIAMPMADLLILCRDKERPIWESMQTLRTNLSPDGQAILQRILPIIEAYLADFGCEHMHVLGKYTWHRLGFDLALTLEQDHQLCDLFFDLISQVEHNQQPLTPEVLAALLDSYPEQDTQASNQALHIMTIHKSKGLEFDIVIVPHLEKLIPLTDKPILDWTYVPINGEFHLLMDAHPRHKSQQNSIHRYLRLQDKQAEMAEIERLYYVAFTRAKHQLHIFAEDQPAYPERSIMKNLAPVLRMHVPNMRVHQYIEPHSTTPITPPTEQARCLPASWSHPLFINHMTSPKPQPIDLTNFFTNPVVSETQWGQLVHCFMEQSLQCRTAPLPSQTKFLQLARRCGISPETQLKPLHMLYERLFLLQQNKDFLWLKSFDDSLSELTIVHNQQSHRFDYACIDSARNILWVIDFKTHCIHDFFSGKTLQMPPTAPESHVIQLHNYATCFARLFPNHEIRTALFYPLVPGLLPVPSAIGVL